MSSNVIVKSRDVDFIENKFQNDSHKVSNDSNLDSEPTNISNSDIGSNNKENDHDPPIEIRRSKRARKEKYLLNPFFF